MKKKSILILPEIWFNITQIMNQETGKVHNIWFLCLLFIDVIIIFLQLIDHDDTFLRSNAAM